MIRRIEKALLLAVFLIIGVSVSAQEGAYGAYSPYSVFGLGELEKEGNAYNKSMGGTGIATRNRRFINYTNPAAVTARDSLSFMADFGLEQKNTVYAQGDLRSANNTFNIHNFDIVYILVFFHVITLLRQLGCSFLFRKVLVNIVKYQTKNTTNSKKSKHF